MWEQLQPEIQQFLITLVVALLGVLSTFLIALAKKGVDWVSEKLDELKDERLRKAAQKAVKDLYDLVTATVVALQQTIGDEIKKSLEAGDGKYTYDDLLALKEQAFQTVNAQLTKAAKEALQNVYTDMDAFIYDLIEQKVREMKSDFVPAGLPATRMLLEG